MNTSGMLLLSRMPARQHWRGALLPLAAVSCGWRSSPSSTWTSWMPLAPSSVWVRVCSCCGVAGFGGGKVTLQQLVVHFGGRVPWFSPLGFSPHNTRCEQKLLGDPDHQGVVDAPLLALLLAFACVSATATMLSQRIPGFVNDKDKTFPRQLFAFCVDGVASELQCPLRSPGTHSCSVHCAAALGAHSCSAACSATATA